MNLLTQIASSIHGQGSTDLDSVEQYKKKEKKSDILQKWTAGLEQYIPVD